VASLARVRCTSSVQRHAREPFSFFSRRLLTGDRNPVDEDRRLLTGDRNPVDSGKTWTAGVTTGYANADIPNLPPATYQVRVFATVGKVPGEPCQPVGLTIH
jgi:hypothetical protein